MLQSAGPKGEDLIITRDLFEQENLRPIMAEIPNLAA